VYEKSALDAADHLFTIFAVVFCFVGIFRSDHIAWLCDTPYAILTAIDFTSGGHHSTIANGLNKRRGFKSFDHVSKCLILLLDGLVIVAIPLSLCFLHAIRKIYCTSLKSISIAIIL